MYETVTIIGGGLAGCEAAWQLAKRDIPVVLWEMKPEKKTPAHHSDLFGELVCSNSLRSDQLENAVGLLKEEMRRLDSLILRCADEHRVAAGGALAVDRVAFSQAITDAIRNHPNITVREGEVTQVPAEGQVIVASGPLTSDALAQSIAQHFPDSGYLHFYDAAAPLVTFESIDMDSAWFASRYDKGTADYINCPLSQEEYLAFWKELREAQEAPVHGFEDKNVFEGCMPVEVMARRGEQTLCFGPLKPRGLPDPKTGKEPYAVVQLRRDNAMGSVYNLVGFQTHLTWPEQKRVFSMIPALPQLAEAPGPVLPGEGGRAADVRRTDHRRGGLCGVHSLRLSGGPGAGPADRGQAPHRLPPGDGHRGLGPVHQPRRGGELPAHERELWHHAPPGLPGEGQAEQERRPVPAGFGSPGWAGLALTKKGKSL